MIHSIRHHQQALEYVHFHVWPLPGDFAQHFHALRDREQRLFFHVFQDRNDYTVEHFFAAPDQVEMPVGDGVEGAWINGNRSFHEGCTRYRGTF